MERRKALACGEYDDVVADDVEHAVQVHAVLAALELVAHDRHAGAADEVLPHQLLARG